MNEDDDDAGGATAGDAGSGAASPEQEGRARKLGWVPKDEWQGDPSAWVSAETFLERIRKDPVFFVERVDNLEKNIRSEFAAELSELKTIAQDQRKVLGEMHERFKAGDRNAYDRVVDDLERQKREAVAEADMEKYEAADRKLKAMPPPPAKEEPRREQPPPPKENPVVKAWVAKNPWFERDRDLHKAAIEVDNDLLESKPDMSVADRLDEVARQVRERFPEKFENPRRQAAPSVTTPAGERREPRRSKSLRLEELPKEDQDAYRRMARMFKEKRGVDYPVEEFLKDYAT